MAQAKGKAEFCPKCGARTCGHGLDPVTWARLQELHSQLCGECGMELRKPGEYHPWVLCVLVAATGDSAKACESLAAVLRAGRSEDRGLKYKVDVFLAEHGQ